MTTIQRPNAVPFDVHSLNDLPTLDASIAIDQDPVNPPSMRRAYRAGAVLRSYAEAAGIGDDEIPTIAAMLIADVMHMCDGRVAAVLRSDDPDEVDQAYRHGFDELVEVARIMHRHELDEI